MQCRMSRIIFGAVGIGSDISREPVPGRRFAPGFEVILLWPARRFPLGSDKILRFHPVPGAIFFEISYSYTTVKEN